jgi:hypothetical protein
MAIGVDLLPRCEVARESTVLALISPVQESHSDLSVAIPNTLADLVQSVLFRINISTLSRRAVAILSVVSFIHATGLIHLSFLRPTSSSHEEIASCIPSRASSSNPALGCKKENENKWKSRGYIEMAIRPVYCEIIEMYTAARLPAAT